MMNSMLRDVVQYGTARKALKLNRQDVAGKTGTTNKSYDAWFNGYVPGLVTIAWFGFDAYKSLGHNQMGGDLALPMWLRYMEPVLKDRPDQPFEIPEEGPNYRRIRVGTRSGTSEPEYEFAKIDRKNSVGDRSRSADADRNRAIPKPEVGIHANDAETETSREARPHSREGEPQGIESLF